MQEFRSLFKGLSKNRNLLVGIIILWAVFIAYLVLTLIGLDVSDHQIVTHYSIFGESHFYRARWWYLTSFSLAGLIGASMHTLLALKLLQRQRANPLAAAVVYGGVVVLLILTVVMLRVYEVASL